MEAPSRIFAALSKETAYFIYMTIQKYSDELSTYAGGSSFFSPDQRLWVRTLFGHWRGPNGQIRSSLELAGYCADLTCSAVRR